MGERSEKNPWVKKKGVEFWGDRFDAFGYQEIMQSGYNDRTEIIRFGWEG